MPTYGLRASLFSLTLALAACGGGGGGSSPPPAPPPPPPPPPTITVSAPASQILVGGQPLLLTASVSSGAAPTWQLNAGAPGKLVPGSSASSILYEPPASGISANTQVTITASVGTVSKQFALTVHPDPGAPGLSLIAGAIPQTGMIDGKGNAASFREIAGVAADSTGGYYACDVASDSLSVRKISAAGEVRTIYKASDSRLACKLAVASDGLAYVLEWLGGEKKRLVRIKPDGSHSVLFSNLSDEYWDIAAGANGAIYLSTGSTLHLLASDGTLTAFATDTAPLSHYMIAGDGKGNLLSSNGTSLFRIDTNGRVNKVELPELNSVRVAGIAGANDGSFYILQTHEALRVHKLTPANQHSLAFESPAPYAFEPKFAVPGVDGRLVLAFRAELRQVSGARSLSFAGMQDYIGVSEDGPVSDARFAWPDAIAADAAGNLYVVDHPGMTGFTPATRGMGVSKISTAGQVSRIVFNGDTGTPTGMAVDRAGNIYISDMQRIGHKGETKGSAIYKIGTDGKFSVLAGCPPSRNCERVVVDGPGVDARFVYAELVGQDTEGNLYANDGGFSPVLRKVSPDGTTVTISALPAGVGAAPDGNRYRATYSTVVQIAPDGKETVVAGVEGGAQTVLGALPGSLAPVTRITPTGPRSFALTSGEAIIKLVLPR